MGRFPRPSTSTDCALDIGRLREEVIAQGIELQRRWLRSIKAQVEEERGGRLSKLDNLTTSFKQLERITLDNSSQLDANVSLHTLWSALRAVQAKVDKGGVAFDDELRVLKTAATAAASSASDEQSKKLVSAMIESIEQSHAATEGIKSFPALSSWFSTTLAPKIQSVSLVPAEHEAGVLSHLASAGLSKVLFRPRAGWVEGDDVGAVLARAEYLLNEKDLDGAARQVNQLQGWAGKLAGDWLREARKRLEVEQALQVGSSRAFLPAGGLADGMNRISIFTGHGYRGHFGIAAVGMIDEGDADVRNVLYAGRRVGVESITKSIDSKASLARKLCAYIHEWQARTSPKTKALLNREITCVTIERQASIKQKLTTTTSIHDETIRESIVRITSYIHLERIIARPKMLPDQTIALWQPSRARERVCMSLTSSATLNMRTHGCKRSHGDSLLVDLPRRRHIEPSRLASRDHCAGLPGDRFDPRPSRLPGRI